MELKHKIGAVVSAGALLFGSLATPAFAASTLQISGNGSDSTSNASVNTSNTTTVVQNNSSNISNHASTSGNTGSNAANDNTGGDVTVLTGDANSHVSINNMANLNKADLSNCGCTTSGDVKISGNGSDSSNNASVKTSNSTSAFQNNQADIHNGVDNHLTTGYNSANENTGDTNGGGQVVILTGNANATTDINNKANANILTEGSGAGSNNGGTLSAQITGNGSDSSNHIKLSDNQDVTAVQNNMADFSNWVDTWAKTGSNAANENTGSNVTIDTGSANVNDTIDNLANFNAASLDCACLTDVTAKVSGNGSDSSNRISADLGNDSSIFQGGNGSWGNNANFDNWLSDNGSTGLNAANENTGPVMGDPVRVFTGNSNATTSVSNAGGVNLFGNGSDLNLPGGTTLEFNFSLSDLLSLMQG